MRDECAEVGCKGMSMGMDEEWKEDGEWMKWKIYRICVACFTPLHDASYMASAGQRTTFEAARCAVGAQLCGAAQVLHSGGLLQRETEQ